MVQYPDGNEDKILVISLSFLKYIQESWLEYQGPYPSLGFVALLYALHTCDQVSLFGFGADHHNTWFHYWDDKYWFNNSMQHFPAERMVIHRLHWSTFSPVLEAGVSEKQYVFSIGTKVRNLNRFQVAKEKLFQLIPMP
ncbi:alpha-N-acetylgalactosaminide alpha-2,6-sialyltransferase 1-like [Microcebus murinus]|uniref:alpha-N-acetylgalactosaminide alpha-2,6-sialyltransferase 1-like n=1 Tax=Microcebus murinus TaxID=30608 RepID=UPI003F6B948F